MKYQHTLYKTMPIDWYRSCHAEEDWEEGLLKFTKIESYGLFGLFNKKIIDRDGLYEFLIKKHWYWGGMFGYFRDHWKYWIDDYPHMKDNPYFTWIPIPAQHLILGHKLKEIHEKYGK